MRMKDRCAVVTGGAGQLGMATARSLLAEGAGVVLSDVDVGRARRRLRGWTHREGGCAR